jgi:LPXTG-motif cell wall-anchored protein
VPAPVAEAPPAPVETAPAPVQAQPTSGSIWPWLLGALLLIGATAFLLRRRRRENVYEDVYVDEREVVAPPVMGSQVADESYVAAPLAAPIAADIDIGRPAIAIQMRPVRAGVTQEDAVVEFELTVDNRGNAPASDVRISTWMFPAGHPSEAERALIQPAEDSDLPAVTIDSGHAKRIESSVALPTAGMDEDAVLPVVVAEAHYRLPDGSEERTSASFEVGVPIGDELAHFDLDNPSGLHEDVVARPHREAIDA